MSPSWLTRIHWVFPFASWLGLSLLWLSRTLPRLSSPLGLGMSLSWLTKPCWVLSPCFLWFVCLSFVCCESGPTISIPYNSTYVNLENIMLLVNFLHNFTYFGKPRKYKVMKIDLILGNAAKKWPILINAAKQRLIKREKYVFCAHEYFRPI